MLLLKVSYRVRAHDIGRFEAIFSDRVVPVIRKHELRFKGIWKTLVGDVGEFLELWEFESMSEFERQWKALMRDPELLAIFEETGPMVENENFSLLEPAASQPPPADPGRYQV